MEASDSDLNYVVKTTVFLKDMNDFCQDECIYGEFFSQNLQRVVPSPQRPYQKHAFVEIE